MHKFLTDTLFIGKKVIYMPKCHSTNDIAIELLEKEQVIEGTVVITNDQEKGRGQRGNTWVSAPGKNLMFSIVLKPTFLPIYQQFYLNIFTSLAILDCLKELVANDITIKWPNDIFFQEDKIGGMLIENTVKGSTMATSVVGIGLNVNQSDFEDLNHVTSLRNICEQKIDLSVLFSSLMQKIESRYLQLKNHKFEKLKEEYLNNMFGYQKIREFKDNQLFEGKIVGIDEVGKLLVMKHVNIEAYDLKEISFILNES